MKYVSLLVLLVVVFSAVLVGGVFDYPVPKTLKTITNITPVTPVIQNSLSEQKSLQFGSLKFTHRINPPPSCTPGNIAVDLLLDTSSSMQNECVANPVRNCKLMRLKQAIKTFRDKLDPDDVLGVQRFSGGDRNPPSEIARIQPVSQISQTAFDSAIDSLIANGGTQTDKGLEFAKLKMNEEFPKYPNDNKFLLLVTDGCPANGTRAISVAGSIKQSLNIKLLSVGIELETAATNEKCIEMRGEPLFAGLSALEAAHKFMNLVASDGMFFDIPSADNMQPIFDEINQTLCR